MGDAKTVLLAAARLHVAQAIYLTKRSHLSPPGLRRLFISATTDPSPKTPSPSGFTCSSDYHFISFSANPPRRSAPSLGIPWPSPFSQAVDHRRIRAVAAVPRPFPWRQNKDCRNPFHNSPGQGGLPPQFRASTAISFPIAPTAAAGIWLQINDVQFWQIISFFSIWKPSQRPDLNSMAGLKQNAIKPTTRSAPGEDFPIRRRRSRKRFRESLDGWGNDSRNAGRLGGHTGGQDRCCGTLSVVVGLVTIPRQPEVGGL